MTDLQLYLLLAPLAILAFAGVLFWWTVRHGDKQIHPGE
jgi:hypothetical protein